MNLQSTTDVFIVGGGPSGLAAAIAARQKGFDVTLADGAAPPIEKPCGEGMMPETITALRGLGITIGPSDGVTFRESVLLNATRVLRLTFRPAPAWECGELRCTSASSCVPRIAG